MSEAKDKEENIVLIEKAKEAKKNSYSPYSKFKVGAALMTIENKIYTGCNIENSSYGATVCAERTAVFKAVSEGVRNFKKIAIASDLNDITYPCGICLQVLSEFMPDGKIILEDKDKNIFVYKISELLPYAFCL
ncbi:MAG: cytidine deaminase [Clostridiales bacterium]|nr:cytidine deaminase [Clostridiales bacterium]